MAIEISEQDFYNMRAQRDTARTEAIRLEKEKGIVLDALKSLLDSFIHTEGKGHAKGNKAKTDIITHNEDVRAALVKAHNIFIYGIRG